jgi:uncharacterized lipoprotein YehR (DUF1307 family)
VSAKQTLEHIKFWKAAMKEKENADKKLDKLFESYKKHYGLNVEFGNKPAMLEILTERLGRKVLEESE